MIKRTIFLFVFLLSNPKAENLVIINLINGSDIEGEFIGTYMNHVHLLLKNKIQYFNCNEINSIQKTDGLTFIYDCNKNTVTADILFPPQINPMTGKWETLLPPPFVEKKQEPTLKTKLNFQNELLNNKKTALNTTQNKPKNIIESEALKHKTPSLGIQFETPLSQKEIQQLIKEEVRKEVEKALPYEIKKQKKTELNNRLQTCIIGCVAWFLILMMIG